MRLNNLRDKLLEKVLVKKVLYILICTLLSSYVFSILTFGLIMVPICYALMGLLIASCCFYSWLYPPKQLLKKRNFFVVAFLFSAFLSTAFFSREWRDYLTIVLMVVTFFTLLASLVIIDNSTLSFLLLIAAFFTFSIIYVIYFRSEIMNFRNYSYDDLRPGMPFENPNTIGNFMSIGATISLYLIFFDKRKIRFIILIPTTIFFFIGFLTGSRTFLVLSIFSTILLVILRFRSKWWITLPALAASIVIFVVLLNFVPIFASLKHRVDETLQIFSGGGLSSGSTLQRIIWQQYGVLLASKQILLGYGENGFAAASGVNTYTHGNFSEMLCNFGIIGFSCFYIALLVPFVYSLVSKEDTKYYVIVLISTYLLNGFLSVYYYDKSTYVSFALIYYLVSKVAFEKKKDGETNEALA